MLAFGSGRLAMCCLTLRRASNQTHRLVDQDDCDVVARREVLEAVLDFLHSGLCNASVAQLTIALLSCFSVERSPTPQGMAQAGPARGTKSSEAVGFVLYTCGIEQAAQGYRVPQLVNACRYKADAASGAHCR